MARTNPNCYSVLDNINNNENNKSNNSCQDCKGQGKSWLILEKGKLVKYVNFFTGKTKIHFDGGLPFLCWPWREHIQIIPYKNLEFSGNFARMQSSDKDDVSGTYNVIYDIENFDTLLENQENYFKNLQSQLLAVFNHYFESKKADDIKDATFGNEVLATQQLKNLEKLFGIKFKRIEAKGLSPETRDKAIKAQTTAQYQAETKKVEEEANREKIQAETITKITQEAANQEIEKAKIQNELGIIDLKKDLELAIAGIENQKLANDLQTILEKIEQFPIEQQALLMPDLYRTYQFAKSNTNANVNITNANVTGGENLYPNKTK